jgi:uncharacterized protein (TIGR03382 family)
MTIEIGPNLSTLLVWGSVVALAVLFGRRRKP